MPARRTAGPAQYIALLRAINVGGHIVKMDRLRALFAELHFDDVATFIASGNVIFNTTAADAAALERTIESHLRRSLGYDVATFLRTRSELAATAAHDPFAAVPWRQDAHGLYVLFTRERPDRSARARLDALAGENDLLHVHEREVYWLARASFSESALSGAVLERALGMPGTMRNITTVARLAAKYPVTAA